jgi:hypothetical protein
LAPAAAAGAGATGRTGLERVWAVAAASQASALRLVAPRDGAALDPSAPVSVTVDWRFDPSGGPSIGGGGGWFLCAALVARHDGDDDVAALRQGGTGHQGQEQCETAHDGAGPRFTLHLLPPPLWNGPRDDKNGGQATSSFSPPPQYFVEATLRFYFDRGGPAAAAATVPPAAFAAATAAFQVHASARVAVGFWEPLPPHAPAWPRPSRARLRQSGPHSAGWPAHAAAVFAAVFNRTDFAARALRDPLPPRLRPPRHAEPDAAVVVAAHPGRWLPSPQQLQDGEASATGERSPCSSPALWVYVYGQYRTFDQTRASLAQAVRLTAGACAFVCGVAAEEPGGSPGDHPQGHSQPAAGSVAAALAALVQPNARTPSGGGGKNSDGNDGVDDGDGEGLFGGRFAYAVVRRSGRYDRAVSLSGALDFWWYSVWLLGELASGLHGFEPNPNALVLRTRCAPSARS